MKSQGGIRSDQGGWTLIELMLVAAMIGIITPAITFLFLKVTQGMAGDEMHNQLSALNSQTVLRLHERMVMSRHLFQGDSSGVDFLGPVTQAMSANTKSTYPILAGSQLAIQQPLLASGLPSFSPSSGADQADFGNSLLFGAYDYPQTIVHTRYPSPVTVFTSATSPVTYSNGSPATIVVDLYRFYYYYLTTNNPRSFAGSASYELVEWQSNQFADYYEINDLGDAALQQSVISWLATAGNVDPIIPGDPFGSSTYKISYAWDPTQLNPTQAFWALSTSGSLSAATDTTALSEAQVTPMTRVTSGILSSGFGYGVSANTAGWNGAPPAVVPMYATASGAFPGGFEVGIAGSSAGRAVMTRCLLVGKGASPNVAYNDISMVHNLRDVW